MVDSLESAPQWVESFIVAVINGLHSSTNFETAMPEFENEPVAFFGDPNAERLIMKMDSLDRIQLSEIFGAVVSGHSVLLDVSEVESLNDLFFFDCLYGIILNSLDYAGEIHPYGMISLIGNEELEVYCKKCDFIGQYIFRDVNEWIENYLVRGNKDIWKAYRILSNDIGKLFLVSQCEVIYSDNEARESFYNFDLGYGGSRGVYKLEQIDNRRREQNYKFKMKDKDKYKKEFDKTLTDVEYIYHFCEKLVHEDARAEFRRVIDVFKEACYE